MKPTHRLAARLAGLGLFAVVLGCGKPAASPPAKSSAGPEVAAATSTDGKGLFVTHCSNCHAAADVPRKGKGRGPDLSHVGSEPEHTADWIAAHIRNPRLHQPSSKMPAFESKLKPEEIKSISDYLSTLK